MCSTTTNTDLIADWNLAGLNMLAGSLARMSGTYSAFMRVEITLSNFPYRISDFLSPYCYRCSHHGSCRYYQDTITVPRWFGWRKEVHEWKIGTHNNLERRRNFGLHKRYVCSSRPKLLQLIKEIRFLVPKLLTFLVQCKSPGLPARLIYVAPSAGVSFFFYETIVAQVRSSQVRC